MSVVQRPQLFGRVALPTETLRVAHEWRSKRVAAYEALLHTTVFGQVVDADRKEALRNQALLTSPDGYEILRLIWMHGRSMNRASGQSPAVLSAYALATQIAEKRKLSVSKVNSRVRKVALAGQAFGLVMRDEVNAKLVNLTATPALDVFMQQLAIQDLYSVETLSEELKVIRAAD